MRRAALILSFVFLSAAQAQQVPPPLNPPTPSQVTTEQVAPTTAGGVRYSKLLRTQYMEDALRAFQTAENGLIQNIMRFLRNQNRYSCGSPVEQIRVQCLIDSARSNCNSQKGRNRDLCNTISDVVVTNLMEEKSFLEKNELNRILRNSSGTRDQMLVAISGRYARLAGDFLVATRNECEGDDWICLSQKLDQFCLQKADERVLAWQGCTCALMWFIGSKSKPEEK